MFVGIISITKKQLSCLCGQTAAAPAPSVTTAKADLPKEKITLPLLPHEVYCRPDLESK